METILIIIHLMIVVALVIVVLLQRSEGGALGIGGGGGLMSARGAANALTRTTAILAAGFFVTSLSLGILARYGAQPTDILDNLPAQNGQTSGEEGSLLDQLGGLPASQDGAAGQSQPASGAAGGGASSPSLIDQSSQPEAPAGE
ncbi:preprotein translocase subunit SecG, partial [Aurantimonas sp. 22II-16-19i]|uniref:preprotein translocase subunit SecG n=1 Tax=Aurantimonas sp. 22II-16-19i TaxID=1317114 RepID=UPI0009F8FA76